MQTKRRRIEKRKENRISNNCEIISKSIKICTIELLEKEQRENEQNKYLN